MKQLELHRSYETEQFFKALRALKSNEEITFVRLSEIVTFDCTKFMAKLDYVRDRLKRRGEMVITRYKGTLRRMPDGEVVNDHSSRYKKKLRNAAHRGRKALESVEYSQLDRGDQVKHNAHQAAFGTISLFTREKANKKLLAAVDRTPANMPVRKVLELFK